MRYSTPYRRKILSAPIPSSHPRVSLSSHIILTATAQRKEKKNAYILHSPPAPLILSPSPNLLTHISPVDTRTGTRLCRLLRPRQRIPLPLGPALKSCIASFLPTFRFPCSRHDLAAREQGDYRPIMDSVRRIAELRGEFWCLVGWEVQPRTRVGCGLR